MLCHIHEPSAYPEDVRCVRQCGPKAEACYRCTAVCALVGRSSIGRRRSAACMCKRTCHKSSSQYGGMLKEVGRIRAVKLTFSAVLNNSSHLDVRRACHDSLFFLSTSRATHRPPPPPRPCRSASSQPPTARTSSPPDYAKISPRYSSCRACRETRRPRLSLHPSEARFTATSAAASLVCWRSSRVRA